MKFSTFVKLGGHAFSLMQNKDLLELYGIAKPTIQKQLQAGKQAIASPSPPPIKQWPTASYPTHFPVPIDSPVMKGYAHPPGMLPPRPPWIYGVPVSGTALRQPARTSSRRNNAHRN